MLRVKFADDSRDVEVLAAPGETFEDVASRVRSEKGWSATQHVRFICGGQEMYLDDPVSRASGSVLHCIATDGAAHRHGRPGGGKPGAEGHAPAVDWLEVVDPGTVLMWIFGSILALLWLLFVFYAHMFDKTSVVMLCMMTVAFLIPCVLSYVPWLRMLTHTPVPAIPPARQPVYYYAGGQQQQQPPPPPHQQPHVGGWQGSYGAAIPPRPAARVRGPGARTPPS